MFGKMNVYMLKYIVWYYYFQFFNIVFLTQKTKNDII